MKRFLVGIFLVLGFSQVAVARGDLGLGFVVGSPTGISGNFRNSNDRSIDATLAWDLGKDDSFVIMMDYLFHNPKSINLEGEMLGWYYGFGARFIDWDDDDPRDDDDYRFGPRAVVGANYELALHPIEFFAELGLVMNLVPKTDADLTIGIGGRYYF